MKYINILIPILPIIYLMIKKRASRIDGILAFIYLITLIIFSFNLSLDSSNFSESIETYFNEPYQGYSPLAQTYLPTVFTFFNLSIFALVTVWIKQRALPPIVFLCCMSMMVIGFLLNVALLLQLSFNKENHGTIWFLLMPIMHIIITIVVTTRVIKQEVLLAEKRKYKMPSLAFLNNMLLNAQTQPLWILVFSAPLFIIIMIILVLLGQDSHAITKAFTETSTWRFSQKNHPPYLPYMGHYLCTVAAFGDPLVVKPLRMGSRHGLPIVVNRQLQIANAFEGLIQESLPKVHGVIRRFYDQYGYPLSKVITSSRRSNITYYIMKPMEYFFVFILYLCCIEPEKKISRQYL